MGVIEMKMILIYNLMPVLYPDIKVAIEDINNFKHISI